MSRIAYVNGRYLPYAEAGVHIDDRGYQFGDGVYEVCEIRDGALIDETRHLARLERSLAALEIKAPRSLTALRFIMREVAARNRVRDGMVYIQATRGVARRDHGFPDPGTTPGLVVTAKAIDRRIGDARAAMGVRVIVTKDLRWARPDIKSLQLLPNVLAKQAARERGAYEAWLLDANGDITEGASTNAWILTAAGVLVTRQADQAILRGVTRTTLLALLAGEGLRFEERAFSLDEAYGAREAFLTSAVNIVMPVVAIDDKLIGDGRPGPLALSLRGKFHGFAEVSSA
ncbi:D-amino-acid transaminase [Methylocapsa sp. S129]|uniref:D-amino-acid transaminase n=1 Tax=Methylocapsa sp. S129 TaxID=1641869 RepID=UPI00131C2BBC|nr:D-amino-acid transaminase [Methylocapsa sp. S129]